MAISRRSFIKSTVALSGAGFLAGMYSWQVEPSWLEFVRMKMPVRDLPPHLAGKTLMQISDVHVGNRFDRSYLVDSFKKAQAFVPDFVTYTGDFVHYQSPEQFDQLHEVFQHAVKGKYGTVGVLGNHDYGHDWREPEVAHQITDILTQKGIRILRNDQSTLEGLNFIGLDDLLATNFKPEQVMTDIRPDAPQVVLCHNPDAADLPIWNGYRGWILAGHTHGGQCKLPYLPAPLVPVKNKKYVAGEIDLEDGRRMYINRALGHVIPVRFNVRPEITVFELVKA